MEKANIMEMNERKVETVEQENELLKEYREQTMKEGRHDYHVDGYYGDYSDSSCCC